MKNSLSPVNVGCVYVTFHTVPSRHNRFTMERVWPSFRWPALNPLGLENQPGPSHLLHLASTSRLLVESTFMRKKHK